jgi:tetratricopeptide (TPR) repeat protein
MVISSLASTAALDLGKLEEAKTWSEATLNGWVDLGNQIRLAQEQLFVARIAALRGDHNRARQLAHQAADLARRDGELGSIIDVALLLGELAWLRGDHCEAARHLSESFDMAQAQAWQVAASEAQVMLALVACEQGAYDRAEELCREAQDGFPEDDQSGLPALARIALCRGDAARAVELYRRYLDDPVRRQHRPDTVEALEYLAWALAADVQPGEAAELLAVAARERDEMGMVLPPVDWPYHEQAMDAVRGALDEADLAAAQERGRARDLDATVAELLGELGA